MYLPEYRAIGVFNPETDSSIKLFSDEQKFLITSKMGEHKACLADQDTDSQNYSKMFALSFKANEELKIEFTPSSFRYINQRTSNSTAFDTAAQADWFLTGHAKPSYSSELQEAGEIKNKYLRPLVNQETLMRMNMYRYNQATKVGSCVGYLQNTDSKINLPIFQGWRQVIVWLDKKNRSPIQFHRVLLKNVAKGLLMDI